MKAAEMKALYSVMFSEYPDIVTVKQLQSMLGISRHGAYDLLAEGEIGGIKLGNAYKIPKINVIRYVLSNSCGNWEETLGFPRQKGLCEEMLPRGNSFPILPK